MLIDFPTARLELQKNQLARLANARNTRMECMDGVAWITLDHDRRDIVLTRGQSFVVDSGAGVIVHALQGPTSIELRAA